MGRPRGDTRDRLVKGAFESLRTRGYAGSSSRAIGAIADVNPALVFYYFETVDELLLAALAESSSERLSRYRAALEGARSPSELVDVLTTIYHDDVASGHITVVSELVAASISKPELGARVAALMEPWIELAQVAIESVISRSALRDVVSSQAMGLTGVIFYLGANLLTQLQSSADVDVLLDEFTRLASLLDGLVGPEDT